MSRNRLQLLMEMGLAVALAAVFHFVRLYQMPQGGTISLEMLPIFVIAFRRGMWPGVVAGAIFGLVDIILEPFLVHPLQVILDYPLAFGLVGTAGLLMPVWRGYWQAGQTGDSSKSLTRGLVLGVTPGVLLGGAMRLASHTLSGILFIGLFAPDVVKSGQNVFLYSITYNSTYMVPTTLVCLVLMWILAPALERIVPLGRPAHET